MFSVAQGAHKGRPVAAALCTPGLWPPKSPLRGSLDLSRQASGRAEAASLQITALSPHPCGLPRPSGNVSAILRPSTPAVSATMVNKLTAGPTNGRPDKAQPPSGAKTAPYPRILPGGAALARAYRSSAMGSPGKAPAATREAVWLGELLRQPGGDLLPVAAKNNFPGFFPQLIAIHWVVVFI